MVNRVLQVQALELLKANWIHGKFDVFIKYLTVLFCIVCAVQLCVHHFFSFNILLYFKLLILPSLFSRDYTACIRAMISQPQQDAVQHITHTEGLCLMPHKC